MHKPLPINLSNQIFHYTRCITPKHVKSLRGPFPRRCTVGTWPEWNFWGGRNKQKSGGQRQFWGKQSNEFRQEMHERLLKMTFNCNCFWGKEKI